MIQAEPSLRGVDGRAMALATLAAAAVALALYLFYVPAAVGAGDATVVLRYMASILLGDEILAPGVSFSALIVLAGLFAHLVVSGLMTWLITFVLHRWGLVTGIIGGALFGLAFFFINHYTLTFVYPHFYAMNHAAVLVVHVVFGAVAGGVYELLEHEPSERLPGRAG